MFGFLIALHLIGQPSDDLDYGEAYVETQERKLPLVSLGVGYGFNISDSFLELNSVMANTQVRLWKYFSTGVFGFINGSDLSPAGDQIRRLESSIDIQAKIPTPRWGLFSLSQFQFMLGRWNLFNLYPLEAELLAGGGLGVLNRGEDTNGPTKYKLSYLWSVEQRLLLSKLAGVYVSLLGHYGTSYFQSGVVFRFN